MDSYWENAKLALPATMADTIKVLNDSAMKIALIVDEDGVLKGVVTDGDIRRAILKKCTLTTPVEDFMCETPILATESDSFGKIRHLLEINKVQHLPIVDDSKKIIGLETPEYFFGAGKIDNPVFLMAGGFGTRLRPLTHDCPKPLLKIGKKPILETIINSFSSYGFENFYISVHYKAEMIKKHFSTGGDYGVDIEYVEEKKPLGTAGALSLLPAERKDKDVVVMNGDLLTKVNFVELLDYHQSEEAAITMCVREYEYQVPYGVIQSENNQVSSVVEKPIEKYFVNAGIYVISPKVLATLNENEQIDMPDLINACLANNEKISIFPIHEYWLDIGRMSDFEQAQSDIVNLF